MPAANDPVAADEEALLSAGYKIKPAGCDLLRHWQVLSPFNRGQYPDGWARRREDAIMQAYEKFKEDCRGSA